MKKVSDRLTERRPVVHSEEGYIQSYTGGKLKLGVSVSKSVRTGDGKGKVGK